LIWILAFWFFHISDDNVSLIVSACTKLEMTSAFCKMRHQFQVKHWALSDDLSLVCLATLISEHASSTLHTGQTELCKLSSVLETVLFSITWNNLQRGKYLLLFQNSTYVILLPWLNS
jgi:hypothetical protein